MAGQKEGIYASLEPSDVGLQNPNQGLTLYPKIPSNDLRRPRCPRKIAEDDPESVPQDLSLHRGEPCDDGSPSRYASPDENRASQKPPAKRRRIQGETCSVPGCQSLSLNPASLRSAQDEANEKSSTSKVRGAQKSVKERLPDSDTAIEVKLECPYHYDTLLCKHPETTHTLSIRENPEDLSESQYTAPSGDVVGGSHGLYHQSEDNNASELAMGKVGDPTNNTKVGNAATSKSETPISLIQNDSCDRVAPMRISITENEGLQKDIFEVKVETNMMEVREPMSSNVNISSFGSPTTKPCKPSLTLGPIPNHPQPQDKPQDKPKDQGKPSQNLLLTPLWTVIASCLIQPVQEEASNTDDPTSFSVPHEVPLQLRQIFDSLVNKFRIDTNFKKSTVTYFMEQFAEQLQHYKETAPVNTNMRIAATNSRENTIEDSDLSGVEEDPFTHDSLNGSSVDDVKKKYRLLERRFRNAQKKMQTLKFQVKHYKKAARPVSLIKFNDPPSTATWACGNLLLNGKACGKKNPHYKGEVTWSATTTCQSCGSSPGKDPISPTGIPLERLAIFRVHSREISQTKECPTPPRANSVPVYGLDATKNQQTSAPQRPLQTNAVAIQAFGTPQTAPMAGYQSRWEEASQGYHMGSYWMPPPPTNLSYGTPLDAPLPGSSWGPPHRGPLPGPVYNSPYGPLPASSGSLCNAPYGPQSPRAPTSAFPCHNTTSHPTHTDPDTPRQASTSCLIQSSEVSGPSPFPSKKRRLEMTRITENFEARTARPGSLTLPTLGQNCHATTSALSTVLTPLPSSSPSPSVEPSPAPPKRRKRVAKVPKQCGRPLTEDEIKNINKSLHARTGFQKKTWQQEHILVSSDNEWDLDSLFEEADEGGDASKSFESEFEAAFAAVDSTESSGATTSVARGDGPDGRLLRDDEPDSHLPGDDGRFLGGDEPVGHLFGDDEPVGRLFGGDELVGRIYWVDRLDGRICGDDKPDGRLFRGREQDQEDITMDDRSETSEEE